MDVRDAEEEKPLDELSGAQTQVKTRVDNDEIQ